MRLDHYIREKYNLTGNKAQQLIKEWYVTVNMLLIQKPAFDVIGVEEILLREEKRIHWVSRSAGKLDGFLQKIGTIEVTGKQCLDVGSSTGGFSQVLLEHGAAHVDAVDVGTDQLHEILRKDDRIMSYEQTDIRDFKREKFIGNSYDIIVCDASFISLREILPSILWYADTATSIILLWKPQFEVGRENLQPKWVPKSEKIIEKAMKIWEDSLVSYNCEILQKEKSSVIGEMGNEEWLYLIKKQ